MNDSETPFAEQQGDSTPAYDHPETKRPVIIESESLFDSATCKDRIRYKLVKRDGRPFFEKVSIIGDDGCGNGSPDVLAQKLEGHFFDEVDLKQLHASECAGGRCKSCFQALADILQDLNEILE